MDNCCQNETKPVHNQFDDSIAWAETLDHSCCYIATAATLCYGFSWIPEIIKAIIFTYHNV